MEINEELAELVGAFIGDGLIGRYGSPSKSYHVEFSGNSIYEREYYNFLSKIITRHFDVNPRFKIIGGTLRMLITYKQMYRFFRDLGFPSGIKNNIVRIPSELYNSNMVKFVVRGIFDTDGFFFLDKRKIYEKPYPRMGFSTKSSKLFCQINDLFLNSGYIVYTRVDKRSDIYHLEIYGTKQIRKWLSEYGIRNERKKNYASVAQSVGIPTGVSLPDKERQKYVTQGFR